MSRNDQRCATTIFEHICHSMIYLITLKKHVQHVSQILKCLNQRNLRLKSKKCEFHQEKVDFLEFVVKRHEIRMNLEKVKAIKK